MSGQIRVLVVSAHNLFRECLTSAIAATDSSFLVSSVESPVRVFEVSSQPDVIILDSYPPNGISVAHTTEIAQQLPQKRILIIGQLTNEADIVDYLQAGAADYRLSDNESIEELCAAIHRVLRGKVSISPERGSALFARLQELSRQGERLSGHDTTSLSTRELQILCLIEKGRSNKEIATQFHLSLHTVKNHVHHILAKLDVHNRREAVHLAQMRGWIKTGSSLTTSSRLTDD